MNNTYLENRLFSSFSEKTEAQSEVLEEIFVSRNQGG